MRVRSREPLVAVTITKTINRMASALRCSSCSFIAPSEVLLLSHIRLVHSMDPNFSIQCTLEGCARTFTNFRTYQNHLLTHRSPREDDQGLENFDTGTDIPIDEHFNDSENYVPELPHLNQLYIAKWILKTSEINNLTRAATLDIIENVSDLAMTISQSLKHEVCDALKEGQISEDIIHRVENVFLRSKATNPFEGLQSFHNQISYYKSHFNLIVRSHIVICTYINTS